MKRKENQEHLTNIFSIKKSATMWIKKSATIKLYTGRTYRTIKNGW